VVGGTGLYFGALTRGLAPIPQVPEAVRLRGEALLTALGPAGLASRLAERDPATAAGLDLANPMRLLRAWEVLEATGQGMAAWHAQAVEPVLALERTVPVLLAPPRGWLTARCDARFDAMLAEGALAEVAAVMARNLPPETPGLRTVGAPELAAHLRGERTLEDAAQAAKAATRRYAKRQATWGRNQMGAWQRLEETDPQALLAAVLARVAAAPASVAARTGGES
jgi:tRNA dimethylallyltransferase